MASARRREEFCELWGDLCLVLWSCWAARQIMGIKKSWLCWTYWCIWESASSPEYSTIYWWKNSSWSSCYFRLGYSRKCSCTKTMPLFGKLPIKYWSSRYAIQTSSSLCPETRKSFPFFLSFFLCQGSTWLQASLPYLLWQVCRIRAQSELDEYEEILAQNGRSNL